MEALHHAIESGLPEEAVLEGEKADNPVFGRQPIELLIDGQESQRGNAEAKEEPNADNSQRANGKRLQRIGQKGPSGVPEPVCENAQHDEGEGHDTPAWAIPLGQDEFGFVVMVLRLDLCAILC